MKTKKSIIAIICIILSIIITTTAVTAAVLYASQARVSFFTGHVENLGTAEDSHLAIKYGGESLGSEVDISPSGAVVFPILSNVKYTTTYGKPSTWISSEDKSPLQAPKFIVTSEGGESRNVNFRIVAHGSDPSRAALRFGVDIMYYADDIGQKVVRSGITELSQTATGETISSDPLPLGDGNIAAGEEVTVYISVWVDKDALNKVGVYPNDDISLEAVFTSGEVTS